MKSWMWGLLFVVTSPWWWLLLKYPAAYFINTKEFLSYRDQSFIQNVNTYQGLSNNRFAVNKYTWLGKEFSDRVLETFDPGFLFFTGDLDQRRSTRTYGPILISLLPAAAMGFIKTNKRNKYIYIFVAAGSAVFSGFLPQHYFVPSRIPILLCFALLSGTGLMTIKKQWNRLSQGIYGTWIFYDMVRFAHELAMHYLPSSPL